MQTIGLDFIGLEIPDCADSLIIKMRSLLCAFLDCQSEPLMVFGGACHKHPLRLF